VLLKSNLIYLSNFTKRMENKYMEIPKRKQNRLKEFDYSNPNAYFITICTNKRKSYFWKAIPSIENIPDDIQLSAYGSFVSQCICDIPKHYPMISVDHYVIMPNHIHLLLQINTDFNGRPMTAPTISMVVNQLKGAVSKQAGFSV